MTMHQKKSIVLRGNSAILYIWPIWVIAIVFGIINKIDPGYMEVTGKIFLAFFLPSLTVALIHLRGLWGPVLLLAALVLILTLAQTMKLTDQIISFFSALSLKIEADAYLLIGCSLGLLTLLSTLFEQRKSVEISDSELIVRSAYKGIQVFDSRNADFRKRRRDWFRYLLGFYAEDLEIVISHGSINERIELRNITDLKAKLQTINQIRSV